MFKIAKWFTGITLAILQLKENFVETNEDCNIEGVHADCVSKLHYMESFSQNMRKDIEVLDMSDNLMHNLTETAFVGFANLKELIITTVEVLSNISIDAFSPLTKLQILNLSHSVLTPAWPKLPSSIKRLILERFEHDFLGRNVKWLNVSILDFSNLPSLEEVYLRGNNLSKFPNISKNVPLTFVDLRENPMKNLKYTDIATFCLLKQFKVDGDRLVQCCGVKMWLGKHNITSDMACAESCSEQQFDQSANEAYEMCIDNLEYESNWPLNYFVLNIAISLAIMLAIAYLVLRYYRSRAVRTEHELKKAEKFESVEEEELQEALPEE